MRFLKKKKIDGVAVLKLVGGLWRAYVSRGSKDETFNKALEEVLKVSQICFCDTMV